MRRHGDGRTWISPRASWRLNIGVAEVVRLLNSRTHESGYPTLAQNPWTHRDKPDGDSCNRLLGGVSVHVVAVIIVHVFVEQVRVGIGDADLLRLVVVFAFHRDFTFAAKVQQ